MAGQSEQDLRRLLTAYYNGNRMQARRMVSQSCTVLPMGTRVAITQRPTSVNVWQASTRRRVTYRDVMAGVPDGPSRGYVGYMITDTIR